MQVRNKIYGGLLAVAAAVALGVSGAGAANAATQSVQNTTSAAAGYASSVKPLVGVFHAIRNVGDNLCLQPQSTADTASIIQMPCDGSALQGWQDRQISSQHYNFINQASGECMDAFDGAFDGARVLQTQCSGNVGNSNQQYFAGATLPAVVSLESRVGFRDTGFCVDVPGQNPTPGLAVQLFSCNGTLAQLWVAGF